MQRINIICDDTNIELFFRMKDSKKELYIAVGTTEITFQKFCANAWNDITQDNQKEGKSLNAGEIATLFGAKISALKSFIPISLCLANPTAKEIRVAITNVSCTFLETCYKFLDKQKNKVGCAKGVYPVAFDVENHKLLCMKCLEIPKKKLFCSRCKRTCYCSAECQKSDWKNHKKICCNQARDEA